jgi:hypothetical protein
VIKELQAFSSTLIMVGLMMLGNVIWAVIFSTGPSADGLIISLGAFIIYKLYVLEGSRDEPK